MKTKLASALFVLLLLCGTIAVSINFVPSAKSDIMYQLDVYSNPSAVPVANGTGLYTDGSWVELDALNEYISGSVKYVFDHWKVDNAGSFSDPHFVLMDAKHNATAFYKTSYKFTVNYPWNALWMESFTPYIWQEGLGFVAGTGSNGTYWAWIPQYEFVQAGISSPNAFAPFGAPWIRGKYLEEVIIFTNWTNLGYYLSGVYAWSNAGKINMTGPMSANMEMKYNYWLWVNSDNPPTPAGQGWYNKDAIATLNAPVHVVNWAYEWRLDHWEVDGVSRVGNPINVTMNTNHTASAFYKAWIWIWLDDDIGNMSGIKDTGKWYMVGAHVFTAPNPVNIDSGHRYGFMYWLKVGSGWTTTANPATIAIDATWAGYTLRTIYHMHYYLTILTDPVGVATIPGSGWYPAGAVLAGPFVAPDPVDIVAGKSHYKFYRWERTVPPGYLGVVGDVNLVGITMDQPKTFVAHYDLEYKLEWSMSPSTISVPGFPGSMWVKNGTVLTWGAPATDTTGNFVFYYWNIDGTTYPQGQSNVLITHNHYITGTAYYANLTKIYMDPNVHTEVSPAYCHTFDVTVYASNFDANRLVSGQPMDIYAFDIGIKWNPALIELQSVNHNLANFFAPNGYFLGINQISSGYYHIVATVKGNFTGFTGTKAIFTMTFHVIADICYNNENTTWIEFDPACRLLSNHLGNSIGPELGWKDCFYKVMALKPMLEIRDHADGDQFVKVDWLVPTVYFQVDVFLLDGVKVHDFYIEVSYDTTQIEVDTVVIANYLKPPYSAYAWWYGGGLVKVWVTQEPSVPLQNGTGLLFTVKFKVIKGLIYTTGGPSFLTSQISINYGELSTYCPAPLLQTTTGGLLGWTGVTYVYNPLPGDLDMDGYVTVLDLQIIIDNYRSGMAMYDVVTGGSGNQPDLYDLVFVALRFGTSIH